MIKVITIGVVIIILISLIAIYSILKTSGECSKVEEKELKNWDMHKYCDDRCIDCSASGWCPFTEVKR